MADRPSLSSIPSGEVLPSSNGSTVGISRASSSQLSRSSSTQLSRRLSKTLSLREGQKVLKVTIEDTPPGTSSDGNSSNVGERRRFWCGLWAVRAPLRSIAS